jgi:MurNAc alpha-1-phosphate uridylyltransferase
MTATTATATPAGFSTAPHYAMVLAAGLGLRMRPLSEHRPKPLLVVAGRTLLDRVIDRLEAAGVEEIVVNAHYLSTQIVDHVAARSARPSAGSGAARGRPARISVLVEAEPLETGGGVAHALPALGDAPFYVVNGDVLWLDGSRPTLANLAAAWKDAEMDALLLMQPLARAFGYDGAGDFLMAADGRLRRPQGAAAPYLFAGIQILSPRLFTDLPPAPFSLNVVYDRAAAVGRLFGIADEGRWFHVGTPQDLALAEGALVRLQAAPAGP